MTDKEALVKIGHQLQFISIKDCTTLERSIARILIEKKIIEINQTNDEINLIMKGKK